MAARKINITRIGGGDFKGRGDPLHTTPRSLFFARVLKVLWGLWRGLKRFGGQSGVKM
nr:MAG TPA: hypothetical protein [Caudoviricetes sp.]